MKVKQKLKFQHIFVVIFLCGNRRQTYERRLWLNTAQNWFHSVHTLKCMWSQLICFFMNYFWSVSFLKVCCPHILFYFEVLSSSSCQVFHLCDWIVHPNDFQLCLIVLPHFIQKVFLSFLPDHLVSSFFIKNFHVLTWILFLTSKPDRFCCSDFLSFYFMSFELNKCTQILSLYLCIQVAECWPW